MESKNDTKFLTYVVGFVIIAIIYVFATDNGDKITKKYVDAITADKQEQIDSLTRVNVRLRARMNDTMQFVQLINTLKLENKILRDSIDNIEINIKNYEEDIRNYGGTIDERISILAKHLRSTN